MNAPVDVVRVLRIAIAEAKTYGTGTVEALTDALGAVVELIDVMRDTVELSDRDLILRYSGRTEECQRMYDRAQSALARVGASVHLDIPIPQLPFEHAP